MGKREKSQIIQIWFEFRALSDFDCVIAQILFVHVLPDFRLCGF